MRDAGSSHKDGVKKWGDADFGETSRAAEVLCSQEHAAGGGYWLRKVV